jgi:hypothetical protein
MSQVAKTDRLRGEQPVGGEISPLMFEYGWLLGIAGAAAPRDLRWRMLTRRTLLTTFAGGSVLAATRSLTAAGVQPAAGSGPHTLPPLPYPFAALEPHIDAQTMTIHHGRHH